MNRPHVLVVIAALVSFGALLLTATRSEAQEIVSNELQSLRSDEVGALPLKIRGKVGGGAGGAIQGALVELIPVLGNFQRLERLAEESGDPPAVATVATDFLGRFELHSPQPGLWRVRITATGYVPMESAVLAILEPLDLPLLPAVPAIAVSIRVVRKNRQPAAGTWVHAREAGGENLWPEGWYPAPRLGRTDASGKISFPRASAELLEINAFSDTVGRGVLKGVVADAEVVLPAVPSRRHVVQVLDPTGASVAGVHIAAGNPAWPVGLTDEAGRAILKAPASEAADLQLFTVDGRRLQSRIPALSESGEESRDTHQILFPAANRLTGKVVERAKGRGVPGALVWPRHDPGTSVFTDREGRYTLPRPPFERFSIVARAPGYLPRQVRAYGGPRADGRAPILALESAESIRGQVFDVEGNPLSGVGLEARLRGSGSVTRRAWSDADGRFDLTLLAAGSAYDLRARKEGYAVGSREVSLEGAARKDPMRVRILLARSRRGVGRVVDGEDRPISGAKVRIAAFGMAGNSRGGAIEALTGEKGFFEVAELPSQRLDIAASFEGFSTLQVRGVEVAAADLPSTQPVDLGTLVLVPGAALVGRITDLDGRPVEDAELRLRDTEEARSVAPGRAFRGVAVRGASGPKGRFEIGDLEVGRRFLLEVRHEDFLPTVLRDVEAPSEHPLTIALEPAAGLRGKVVSADGKPVPGARIGISAAPMEVGVVEPPGRRAEASRSTRADETGSFRFSGLVPGDLELYADADGYRPSDPKRVSVAPRKVVHGVLLTLERGSVLDGRVVDEGGEPVAEARIRLASQRAVSDVEGAFRLIGLPTGLKTLRIEHPGFERLDQKLFVEAGGNVLELVLRRGLSVSGRALTDEGDGIAGAQVVFEGRNWRDPRRFEALTQEDGAFVVYGVVDGGYDLEARAPGFAVTHREGALRVVGESVEGLEIVLKAGSSVFGQVLGLEFEELMGAEVFAADGDVVHRGTLDHEGRFEVADLGEGSWLLTASVEGGRRETSRRVAVRRGGERLERDLVFDGVSLRGVVTYDGGPLPDTTVTVTGRGIAAERSVVTDYQGVFELQDLEPARYRLSVSNARELLNHSRDVSVFGPREIRVDLQSAAVSGRVVSADGSRPLPEALVIFTQLLPGGDTGSMVSMVVSEEGTFHVARLTPGRYRLEARKDSYAPSERFLEVRGGEDREGLEIPLKATEGIEISARLASGRFPESLLLTVLDTGGQLVFSELRIGLEGGTAWFPTVPSGTWNLLVSTPGGAATRVPATVPGPTLEVVLPDAGRLRVQVLALSESNLLATLRLADPQGVPFEAVDGTGQPQREWKVTGGTAVIKAIPAGTWSLQVVASDGQVWQGRAITTGRAWTEVEM